MLKKKNGDGKTALLRDFKAFALQLLRTRPVIGLEELAERVRHKFAARIAAGGFAKRLKSGRTEWANLVDWVKADLTGRDWIRYFTVRQKTYIAFLPTCGEVNEVGLVTLADAIRLRNALIDLAVKADHC